MLFCYPIEATQDNWLHECLVEILQNTLQALNDGCAPVPWPACIPVVHRKALRARPGFQSRLQAFLDAAAVLSNAERKIVMEAIISENDFPGVFDGHTTCACCDQLPTAIQGVAKELARFAFSLLTELGLRDQQYSIIYGNISSRICPFCGCECFDAPGAPRPDLDHYLPISRYPFAGTNLKNLVPAGDRCNSAYKRDADILVGTNGQRRACFDPYGDRFAGVSLRDSRPFAKNDGRLAEWEVDLGNTPEAATWDAVWGIKERYKRDVLDAEYKDWLEHFAQWCKRSKRSTKTGGEIIDTLQEYIETVIQEGFADRAFLKRAMFEMIVNQAQHGAMADRLSAFLIALTSADRGAAA